VVVTTTVPHAHGCDNHGVPAGTDPAACSEPRTDIPEITLMCRIRSGRYVSHGVGRRTARRPSPPAHCSGRSPPAHPPQPIVPDGRPPGPSPTAHCPTAHCSRTVAPWPIVPGRSRPGPLFPDGRALAHCSRAVARVGVSAGTFHAIAATRFRGSGLWEFAQGASMIAKGLLPYAVQIPS
jgi:hypothetical protein